MVRNVVVAGMILSGFAGFVVGLVHKGQRAPVAARATPKTEQKAKPTPPAPEPERPRLSAKLLEVGTAPFTSPNGREFVQLRIRWQNTGTRPARAVYAVIHVEDELGRELIGDTGGADYPIYAVSDDAPGVAPGETFILPAGEGYVIPVQAAMRRGGARYSVRITRVREDGF